jgi:hypothetical protein
MVSFFTIIALFFKLKPFKLKFRLLDGHKKYMAFYKFKKLVQIIKLALIKFPISNQTNFVNFYLFLNVIGLFFK